MAMFNSKLLVITREKILLTSHEITIKLIMSSMSPCLNHLNPIEKQPAAPRPRCRSPVIASRPTSRTIPSPPPQAMNVQRSQQVKMM